ncbi:hypothetical protein E2C01_011700 [Portunus trituberculatus]|uniref:Uncharacterized protein n=1 Tax=Portunus trituberculatus TaxID=210409 RepID=A0A5B7DCJ4_PORTR|nr:hypothetical protein [Portunus trituberculatus]
MVSNKPANNKRQLKTVAASPRDQCYDMRDGVEVKQPIGDVFGMSPRLPHSQAWATNMAIWVTTPTPDHRYS